MTYPTSPRTIDELVVAVHRRAGDIHRNRTRKRLVTGSIGMALAAALTVGIVATEGSSGPHQKVSAAQGQRSAVDRQVVEQALGPTAARRQPPFAPVGAGWSVAEPSVSNTLPADWAPLVTSGLKVLEHEVGAGTSATLQSVTAQTTSQVAMDEGPYAGTAVQVDQLSGTVIDSQGTTWTMHAISQSPFSDGGSVAFQGDCTTTVTKSSVTAKGIKTTDVETTCTNVDVDLVGDPTNPYSATVSYWRTIVASGTNRTYPPGMVP